MVNNQTETTENGSNIAAEEGMSFAEMFEQEQLAVANVGDVVEGNIIGISGNYAIVDIGDKSESEIPLNEFKSEGEEVEVKVGDVFDVFVEKREAEGGLKLSREKAVGIKVWEDIASIQEADGTRRIYRSYRWGAHAELFILDARSYRSENSAEDTVGKTMLGRAQLDWLKSGLAASDATWKIISNDVPVSG